MSATTIPTEITTFAARVREQLADLTVDELDELTDGLEADLAEAYAEDLARELPDPVAYAAELRAAAGLPPRAIERRGLRGAFASFGEGMRETAADAAAALRRNPATGAVLDFVVALRPVWWILRAWVAVWLLMAFFGSEGGYVPASAPWFLLLVGVVVVSVQWGRGQWGAPRLLPLLVVGNLAALALAVPVVAMAGETEVYAYTEDYGYAEPPAESRGISLDGRSVTNIYPYDAQGRPLSGVQLFDQDGRALRPALDSWRDECVSDCSDDVAADGTTWAPTTLETGEKVDNVFPASLVKNLIDEYGEVTPDGTVAPVVPTAPYVKVPALAADELPSAAPGKGAADAEDE